MSDETKAALLSVVQYVAEHCESESRLLYPDPNVIVEVSGLLQHIESLGISQDDASATWDAARAAEKLT